MGDVKISDRAIKDALIEHRARIWRFALGLSGHPDTADDLLQMTCVRALERRSQVTSLERVDAWFMTICRSIWLNGLRSEKLRRAQSLTVAHEDLPSGQIDAETNIFAGEVFKCVMALPEAQREVSVLVFVEGYSYREAADVLDVPIGTVMSRLSAARAKLRAAVDPGAEDKSKVMP